MAELHGPFGSARLKVQVVQKMYNRYSQQFREFPNCTSDISLLERSILRVETKIVRILSSANPGDYEDAKISLRKELQSIEGDAQRALDILEGYKQTLVNNRALKVFHTPSPTPGSFFPPPTPDPEKLFWMPAVDNYDPATVVAGMTRYSPDQTQAPRVTSPRTPIPDWTKPNHSPSSSSSSPLPSGLGYSKYFPRN